MDTLCESYRYDSHSDVFVRALVDDQSIFHAILEPSGDVKKESKYYHNHDRYTSSAHPMNKQVTFCELWVSPPRLCTIDYGVRATWAKTDKL